jgi:hypothetical protein
MQEIHEMIASHPDVRGKTNDALIRCISECFACAQACISCADACIAEDMVTDLRQCIRLNMDCADICMAAGKLAIRRSGGNEQSILDMLQACRNICVACGRNARSMPRCTSIAASARKAAAAVRKPAKPPLARSAVIEYLVKWCCQGGLNSRPLPYQGSALPLSYGSAPVLQAGGHMPQAAGWRNPIA